MIRINLLPVKAAKRRELGQRQILLAALVIVAAAGGIVVFNSSVAAQVEKARAHNEQVTQDITRLKAEIGDYDVIKRQREDLIRQRDAIKKLESNRAGPVWLMRELSDILTKGKGPTFDKEAYEEQLKRDPSAGFNPNWDPHRVWLLSYEENNHSVRISGAAKSDEDVAEFLKRLKLSAFFSDVYWQQTQPTKDVTLNVPYVTFDVTCKVNY